MKARLFLAAGMLLLVSACGVKTGLQRPGPMWGSARDQYLADQARAKAEADARAAAGQPAPSVAPPLPPNAPTQNSPIAPTLPPG